MCSTPFGIPYVITRLQGDSEGRPMLCSTPFGIPYVITGTTGRALEGCPGVLNAFRHPICHHDEHQRQQRQANPVLNAFRHPICHHSRLRKDADYRDLCSTPFGIPYVITSDARYGDTRASCAQRLSASHMSSRPGVSETISSAGCAQRLSASHMSSPRCSCVPAPSTAVLNAFRHPICHHPSVLFSPRFVVLRAQRLSASHMSSLLDFFLIFTIPPSRAQRLSASHMSSRRSLRRHDRRMTVLNAFRHPICHHTARKQQGRSGGMCSTPFGIPYVITLYNCIETVWISSSCSTPFGIPYVITAPE